MRFFRRSLVALGIAATLPTVVFAALGVFYLLRIERDRIENATLERTATVMALVDSRVQRDLAVLHVLTLSGALDVGNWPSVSQRMRDVLHDNEFWATTLLIDPHTVQEVLQAPNAPDAPRPLRAVHVEPVRAALTTGRAQVGLVERGDPPVVWLYAPVVRGSQVIYVMAAAIRTDAFQELLLGSAAESATAAVVDRTGNFIARSIAYRDRVGTPAAKSVRDAMQTGMRGFYRGETLEGSKNYSAFHTSDRTLWSTHIAVASSAIDTPTTWSFAVAALAGLGSALLAGVLIVIVLRDMAERRLAEETLRQSQKMEAVGQLTGGIAHDFNDLLTAIIGNLDMIQTRADNDKLRRLASNALEAARRGAKLAAQLLAFSRTQRMTVRRIDLRQLLNGMSGLLTQSVGPSVRVQIDIDPDANLVVSDANQLELALLNIAVNARDAMAGSGTLTITAKRAERVDRSLPPGEYVDICISDTGAGMTEEVRARAVEPFFTTKPLGQGTGLGLSQVYGVVRESGGALSLQSEPGKGTTVRLTLRKANAMSEPTPTRPPAIEQQPPNPSGTEHRTRVLVVDDDRLVRSFMRDSLRNLGYNVMEASDGPSALSVLDSEKFDLLLVDFAMPGMNGAEVARQARAKQPDIRILIVSGYADSSAVEAAIGSCSQLRKPFDLAELRAAVKEILEREVAET